ncbi:MAG: flagellar basal-body rod protein FlgG [Deltaproteobacteria bacterium]|nr:MAG: flagellar basal-body rod protein FlgG [Deltaproteobacteria bacterium]
MKFAGTNTSATTISPTGIEVGVGVRSTSIQKHHTTGPIKETGNELDIAIAGKGFFQVQLPDGTIGYTRDGAFKKDETGQLTTSDGYPLIPNIVIPADATFVEIGNDGTVSVKQAGQIGSVNIGQIETALFINPAGLHSLGDNNYINTNASGDPIVGVPGLEGRGQTKHKFLETANVQLVVEMTDLISGQRAYEAGSKAITTSDEMLQTVNGLKR